MLKTKNERFTELIKVLLDDENCSKYRSSYDVE